ncbi:2-dehydropantoate 2-reductase [Mesorhizobium sp. L-8-10]|uniref:ketopantoate reductase family protein n=1 Tax=Mesorhizobium sp. L-8-10 TaxID=2744523 RepID=UPI001926CA16|nr:ketopantoate reductase family protein [Mesorhizobium sp. L-8-10]BCH29343.1 2-dehydropantoate 2-reductase [Mesorhizobium sp. L-8-10]
MGERVLVWGTGAIGGTVGAYLARAGHEITFVDASPDHVAAIRRNGLRIVGDVDNFVVHASAVAPAEVAGEWRVVLLAVKAQHTQAACTQLLPHLEADCCVVSLQNGLRQTVIENVIGAGRCVPALVGFMGDRLGPGEIRFGKRARFCIGEGDGALTPRVAALTRLLADFEPAIEATDDIQGYLWGKLGFMALLSATALGMSTIVDLFMAANLLPVWRALAGEVLAVASAHGIAAKGFDGFDPAAFLPGVSEADARLSLLAMAAPLSDDAKPHSGMWRDIAIHHRETEIAHQFGPVIELARAKRVPVPALERLVKLMQAVESGRVAQADSLISKLVGASGTAPLFLASDPVPASLIAHTNFELAINQRDDK